MNLNAEWEKQFNACDNERKKQMEETKEWERHAIYLGN